MNGTGDSFRGRDREIFQSLAVKMKIFFSLSEEDQKYFKDIYWERHEIERSFNKFKDYFNYVSTIFDDQEKQYKQELDKIYSKNKKNEPQLVTLEWMKASVGVKKFGIEFKQVFYSSLLISLVSFVEDMLVTFSKKYFSDYEKPREGIILHSLRFLKSKNITNRYIVFEDAVIIRNAIVHHNARVIMSKKIILKIYHIKKDSLTNKMVLSNKFIYNLIVEAENLFNEIYQNLSLVKALEKGILSGKF